MLVLQLAYLGISFIGATLMMRWAFAQFDPNRGSKERVHPRHAQLAEPASAITVGRDTLGTRDSLLGCVGGGKEEGDPAQDRQACGDRQLRGCERALGLAS